ncbi:MAG: hypothetical protein ACLQBK_21570 [Candidatus Sulfotelmatobacter sp.]
MKASPTIRRIAIPFALAIVIACVVTPFSEDAAALTFLLVLLPSWIALFFAWPFLSRKLSVDSQRSAALRQPHWFSFNRLVITGMLALLFFAMLATVINSDFGAIWILPFWLALYFGWYYLTRRFPSLNTEIARARSAPASSGSVQPRPRYAWKNAKVLALVLLFLFLLFLPVMLSFQKASMAHNSIHVGMTLAEVLPTVKECDLFSASSDFPHDKRTDGGKAPELRLSWNKDGTYRAFDPAAGRIISMTESEAVEYLHATLHEGYTWTFHYTYNNVTPEHVTFHVVFGTDGRVSEVKDIYGFD